MTFYQDISTTDEFVSISSMHLFCRNVCVCVCCCLFVIFFFRFLYSTFAASLRSVEVGAAAAGFLRRHGHHCLGGCLLRPASDGRVIGREREGLHNGGRMFETWEFRKLSKNTSCVIQVTSDFQDSFRIFWVSYIAVYTG